MADEVREFVRNYEQCYISVKTVKTGVKRPFVPMQVGPDGGVKGYLVSRNLTEKIAEFPLAYLQENSVPIVPSIGYYNVSITGMRDFCLYVDVSPARQYRKALDCAGGNRVEAVPNASPLFNEQLMAIPAGRQMTVRSKLLAYCLAADPSRKFLSFRDATNKVASGEVHSAAVSRFVALALFPNYRVPIILFKNQISGFVDGNIVAGNENLMPLKDFFDKRWNITLRPLSEVL